MEQKKKFKLNISRKTRRRFVRVVLVIIGLYVLLLAGLSIYISSSHEKLISFLNTKIKETILGEFKINKADITIWRTFPDIGITLENVSISDSFYHRPFLRAKEITVKTGFLGLMGSKVKISSIEVKDALIHTFTDAKGYTNSYVLQSQNKSKRRSKKPVVFSNLKLENVTVIIEDVPKNKRYEARIDDADIDTRLTGSKYYITMDEDLLLRGLGFNMAQGYWLENQRIQAKWKLEFDTSGSVLTIKETKVKIQNQPFVIKGIFNFGKSQFQLNAVTKNIAYSSALSIVKPKTRTKLQKLNLTKPVNATVTLSGSLSKKGDPSVNIDFKTAENNINTPIVNLTNCNFSGNYNNQVNTGIEPDDSNSRISVSSFISSWGDIILKAKNISLTNLRTPVIQFEFFSQCTLQELDEQLASASLRFVDGNAKLYLSYKGPLIADPSLLNQLDAKIQIQNGKIMYVPRGLTFSECNGAVNISGTNLLINNFQCNLNTNHFVVNVNGNNLNRLSNSEPGKASIACNVFSPAVDLCRFSNHCSQKKQKMQQPSKKVKGFSGTADAIDNAIEDGDLFVNLKTQQLMLHNFEANNVIANVVFKNDDWEVRQASLQHADGN